MLNSEPVAFTGFIRNSICHSLAARATIVDKGDQDNDEAQVRYLTLLLQRPSHFGDEFGVGLEADGVLQVGLCSGSVTGVAV